MRSLPFSLSLFLSLSLSLSFPLPLSFSIFLSLSFSLFFFSLFLHLTYIRSHCVQTKSSCTTTAITVAFKSDVDMATMRAAALEGKDILDFTNTDSNDMQIYKIYRRKLQYFLLVISESVFLMEYPVFYIFHLTRDTQKNYDWRFSSWISVGLDFLYATYALFEILPFYCLRKKNEDLIKLFTRIENWE